MTVSESTKQYFLQVSERAEEYFDALEFAKEYVLERRVLQNKGIIECMLMSILWVASNRDDNLTEEDVCMFLNVDTAVKKGDISVELVPEMKTWSLEQVLEYVNEIHGNN